jgi:hypothetical protein
MENGTAEVTYNKPENRFEHPFECWRHDVRSSLQWLFVSSE